MRYNESRILDNVSIAMNRRERRLFKKHKGNAAKILEVEASRAGSTVSITGKTEPTFATYTLPPRPTLPDK